MGVRVLLVDDKDYELQSLQLLLTAEGYDATGYTDPREALAFLERERVDVIVTDLQMPGMTGIQLSEAAKDMYPDVEVVVVTAFGTIETAVEAMKLGAFHYIVKSPRLGEELLLTLERIQKQLALKNYVQELEGEVSPEERLVGLVGKSPEMLEVFRLIRSVAPHNTTVLIRGETGTGKGLVARAMHSLSNRRSGPFVVVDCAALPQTLLESELFGHSKGAFTGAVANRDGKVKSAGTGTVCLDEIGDLPIASQPKLLRLLEERVYSAVGSDVELTSDARVIASTNCALEEMVEDNTFRLDLYHRLNVVTLSLPALRHRRQDLPLLANYMVKRVCRRLEIPEKSIHSDAMATILRYPWPGNVRQLVHAMERAIVVGGESEIRMGDLPPEVIEGKESPGSVDIPEHERTDSLQTMERRLVSRVLSETGWNIHESSRRLEISRPTLYSKIKKFGLTRDD